MESKEYKQGEIILEMDNITKSFPGVVALSNVNFRLVAGKVHALMGENGAGKSTLMKIIAGIYQADEGNMYLHGKEVKFLTPKHAMDHKIAMIHQELSPILDMTVAENLFLGREFLKHHMVDHKKMNEEARALLNYVGMDIEPGVLMKNLTVSQMQMVEIAKALSFQSKVIIMDEPTATITEREVANLFRIIEKLKELGKSIVYITHKMDEVFRISDEITIFRDGTYVGTYDADKITEQDLIRKMVDRELTEIYPPKKNIPGEVILKVNELCQKGVFEDISFELQRGEILGFSGLMGSGRTEIMNALFGITKPTSGEIYIKGELIRKHTPSWIMKKGIGYVTEDRKGNGLVLDMNIFDNICLPSLSKVSNKFGMIEKKEGIRICDEYVEKLEIKSPSIWQTVKLLSGGNQQKIVLSKWLLQNPDILIFDEPTRGIDVGAKTEIYKMIANLARQGKAIIFISSEMPEVLGMSDRLLVFYKGRKKGELSSEEATQEKIMAYASDLNHQKAV